MSGEAPARVVRSGAGPGIGGMEEEEGEAQFE